MTDIIFVTLAHDFFRYLFGAGGVYLLINVCLAPWLTSRKIRAATPDWHQMSGEILASLRTVLIFTTVGVLLTLAAIAGYLNIYSNIQTYGLLWFWASVVLIIVVHDGYFYWAHWLMHRHRWLRRFHLQHHKSYNPTAFTSYAFDPVEAIIQAVFLPLFVLFVPMHPLAIFIFTSHMMLRNALGHCGHEVFPANSRGCPAFGWMTTVTHHDLHHAHAGYNLGLYFSWWDRWMGTEHPSYLEEYARVANRQLRTNA
jgi:Delta7-sterol 5-desaturase